MAQEKEATTDEAAYSEHGLEATRRLEVERAACRAACATNLRAREDFYSVDNCKMLAMHRILDEKKIWTTSERKKHCMHTCKEISRKQSLLHH